MPGTAKDLISAPASSIEWMGNCIPRLVAGTAQLGMRYGIANQAGAPSQSSATEVVEAALDCRIRFFDTAQAYGNSEAFLGQSLRELGATNDVHVISKLDPGLTPTDSRAVWQSVEQSVERIGGPLWAMLLHRPDSLAAWDQGVGTTLGEAQRQGLVQYLGASVYSVDEARRTLEHKAMDIVQVPASAWDQRMLRQGIFRLAAGRNKLCFVRSIFLQGLLTLAPEAVATRLGFAQRAAERWAELAARASFSPAALAVRCALPLNGPIVAGMESADQVRENARLFELEPLAEAELDEIHRAMSEVLDERILNPSRWQETL
jgi:aryl-alcohol dehydrogenase-like predicted oxidoreductase